MALIIQRSVTFPPIGLKKIDEYVTYVARRAAMLAELRERGLEIGRGRGDITRFLERVGAVQYDGACVRLTSVGALLVSLKESLGLPAYHALLYQRVPQYRVVVDVAAERLEVGAEDLYAAANERISKLSSSAWLNRVAFRALVRLAEDAGAISRQRSLIRFQGDPVVRAVLDYCERRCLKIGREFYAGVGEVLVSECSRIEPPHDMYRVDVSCVVRSVYGAFAP